MVLDSGPLGLVSNPSASPVNYRCGQWSKSLLASGARVVMPEIADYEVRRELLRVGKMTGLRQLDGLKRVLDYAPLTTDVMLLAAQFWADARRHGRPTADPHALDGDVILAARANLVGAPGDAVVVATTNPIHIGQFVDARTWESIPVP